MKKFSLLYIASLGALALIGFVILFILALLSGDSMMPLGFWGATLLIIALIMVIFIFNLALLVVFALPFFALIRKFFKFTPFWVIVMGVLAATINYCLLPHIYDWANFSYIGCLAAGLLFAATFLFIKFKFEKRQKKLPDYKELFG